jgi:hypothetical protein
MTTQELERMHRARPFVPFSIFVGDGREIRVDHPEMMAYAPKAPTCAVWSDGAFEIIDLRLITTLKPRPTRGIRRRRAS